jgi:hypothetical protein
MLFSTKKIFSVIFIIYKKIFVLILGFNINSKARKKNNYLIKLKIKIKRL